MSEQRRVRSFEIGERLFDRYDIFARFTGGMATVYGAVDVEDRRRYAIKTCGEHADQAAIDTLFREEIAFALALEQHLGILRLRFVDALGDQLFAFFNFIAGGEAGRTLRDHIDAGAITRPLLGSYAIQIARALAFVSERRSAAHLDLKPSNILIDAGGTLRISDFGLSRSVELFRTRPAAAAGGTASYMSPEQRDGGVVDERADIYAFGVIVHEMLTGAPPSSHPRTLYWDGFDRAQLQEPLCRELTAQQLGQLGVLVGACIDTAALDRFQTFGNVVQAITAIFDDLPAEEAPDDDAIGDKLRRARSWQVIGEHGQCLRVLNRLLVEHPDCVEAFGAATRSFCELAARGEQASPPALPRREPDRTPAPRDVIELVPRYMRERRFATGLRHLLRALEAHPGDERLLEFAAALINSGMDRSTHVAAAELGEQLSDELLSNPLLDSIFCQCSAPGCNRIWVPMDWGDSAIIFNSVGGQCPRCRSVLCRRHIGHASSSIEYETPVCPKCRIPLERISHPTGRQSPRLHRSQFPTVAIVLYREGPLAPDLAYARKVIELLAPDSLEAGARIRMHGVVDWNHIEARRDGLFATYPPPRFEVETTPAAFEGEQLFVARVLRRSGSAGDDAVIRFPVDPPEGEPRIIDRQTATICDVFRAHIARTPIVCRDCPDLVYRCAQLLDARLLEPAATAALRCLQQSLQQSAVVSTAVLTEALALAVSAVPAVDPADARRCFPRCYVATLAELARTVIDLPRGLDIAHWILCSDGQRHVAHLCYLPFDGIEAGIPPLLPTELMTEAELQSVCSLTQP